MLAVRTYAERMILQQFGSLFNMPRIKRSKSVDNKYVFDIIRQIGLKVFFSLTFLAATSESRRLMAVTIARAVFAFWSTTTVVLFTFGVH